MLAIIPGQYVEIKCQLDATEVLLQILLLAQHVSGTTMPIMSSRVLYSGCCLWYFVLWFSSSWSSVELRVMCPVCRMLVHIKTWTLLHDGCCLQMQVFWDVTPCHWVFPDVSKNRSAFFFKVKHCKKTFLGLLRPEDEGTLYNPEKCREIPYTASQNRGPESSAVPLWEPQNSHGSLRIRTAPIHNSLSSELYNPSAEKKMLKTFKKQSRTEYKYLSTLAACFKKQAGLA